MKPLNIMLAIQHLNAGGAERQLIELALGLRQLGHNVTICCLNELGILYPETQRHGLKVVCLGKKGKHQIGILYSLAALLRREQTDVLQTFLFSADLWGRLAGKLAGTKVIITSNRSGGRLRIKLEKWSHCFFWPLADGLISNTNIGKELLQNIAKTPDDYIKVVYNGFEFKRFENLPEQVRARKSFNLSYHVKVVAMIGTVWPVKNHKMMVRVAQKVKDQLPNVRFLVVGVSVKGWDQVIRQYAEQNGVSENLMFLGQRTDVPELLAAADAGILCSLSEGFPNAIMEYMAAGLPVVATDVGGVRDLVMPDRTGYLVPSDDAPAMAQKLLEIFNDPVKARAMGTAGKEWVQANCDFMQLAQKTEAIYREIYQRKTGKT